MISREPEAETMEEWATNGATSRWTQLRAHGEQRRYRSSDARFIVMPPGRRSGKSELAKRKVITRAFKARGLPWSDPRFFLAAPTREQAKRIFWADLKAFIPSELIAGEASESTLTLKLVSGAEISVLGMDKPERIEGTPWDGGVLDEYANMKEKTWGEHVRPALSDRRGWCDFIGVPEGRNHYFHLYNQARQRKIEDGNESPWDTFHWRSEDILPADEIAEAKRDLDPLTFEQEYGGSFVSFEGRCYYPFHEAIHVRRMSYDPQQPLILCFDFNVAPGVCVVAQELRLPGMTGTETGTAVIGEVYIPRNSNTPAVCRKLINDWGSHAGLVLCYGDSSGGANKSSAEEGNDWELIKRDLGKHFGDRVVYRVPPINPSERARINAVNTRLKSGDGRVNLVVDGARANNVVLDFEGVQLLKGGSGEIDKAKHRTDGRTHISDALGYYIVAEFPVRSSARAGSRQWRV